MADDGFYYCLKHKTVEPAEGCKAADRLGPYPDRAAAETALEQVASRNDQWEHDPAWNDEDDGNDERR